MESFTKLLPKCFGFGRRNIRINTEDKCVNTDISFKNKLRLDSIKEENEEELIEAEEENVHS